MICGVVCNVGPRDEPMACGYAPGHDGNHSWSWVPTFRSINPGKTTRCTHCDDEFNDEDLVGATGCPKCGTKSLPCDIEEDCIVQINWHELRILGIWASNWASKECDETAQSSIRAIVRRLEKQKPNPSCPALTLLGELMDLKAQGVQVEAIDFDDRVLVGPAKKGEA